MNGSTDEIIDAREDPASGGFRFGLRGLIASMGLVAGVMGLVQWLGMLGGIGLAAGIVVVALSGLVVMAMGYRLIGGPQVVRGRFLKRCEAITPGLIIWAAILINGVVFAGGAQGLTFIMARRALHAAWHDELGFHHRRISIYDGNDVKRFIEVTSVAPGSPSETAGLRQGDVIGIEEDRFFRSLERRRGEALSLEVGSGGTTGVWDDYQKRQAELVIPDVRP